jgi:hypothetical protein
MPAQQEEENGAQPGQALTALPVRVAHLEVAAGAGRVLATAFRAADILDLLAQALEGGIHLEVTVTDNIGIISPVVAATIARLLLRWLGQEAEVVTTAGRTRGTRRSRRTGRTLHRDGRGQGLPVSKRSWGCRATRQRGKATYNRTSITSATTRTRRANGAGKTIESIFASSTSRARRTLEGKRSMQKA